LQKCINTVRECRKGVQEGSCRKGIAEMHEGSCRNAIRNAIWKCRKGIAGMQKGNAGIAECRNCRMQELQYAGIAEMQKFRNYINIEMQTCKQ
jgi:hypothetical protein